MQNRLSGFNNDCHQTSTSGSFFGAVVSLDIFLIAFFIFFIVFLIFSRVFIFSFIIFSFSQKKKNKLYELGKKNYNSYAKPKSSWNGSFVDFNPFGKKYHDIKKKSLQEALHPENNKDYKPASIARITTSALIKKIYAKLPIESPNELARAMEITKKMLDFHNTVKDDIDFNGKANKVYKSDLRRKREDENAAKDKENNKKYEKSNQKDV